MKFKKNVSNAFEKIKDSEKDHKSELETLKIEDDQKCYLIQIST